jgi:hypothetical protein
MMVDETSCVNVADAFLHPDISLLEYIYCVLLLAVRAQLAWYR